MSIVWLAANAVWYITSRLLRARASQGLSEPDSTPKIWLPCCWLMELTIRDPATESPRPMMSIPCRPGPFRTALRRR